MATINDASSNSEQAHLNGAAEKVALLCGTARDPVAPAIMKYMWGLNEGDIRVHEIPEHAMQKFPIRRMVWIEECHEIILVPVVIKPCVQVSPLCPLLKNTLLGI